MYTPPPKFEYTNISELSPDQTLNNGTLINITVFNTSGIQDGDLLINSTEFPENFTLMSTLWTTAEPDSGKICDNWLEAQHALFQLANLCFAISFLTPSSFKYHCLFLRSLLLLGFAMFIFWSGLVVCMLDFLGWNVAFFIINFCHIIYLGYSTYPVKFHAELEELYIKVFKPLKMTRFEFKSLTRLAKRYNLEKSNTYAVESVTKCGDKFSILLKGRLKVAVDKVFLHYIEPNQFVDSPEYESVSTETSHSEKYQVTITSAEDSCLLVWPIQTLDQFLQGNEYCNIVITTLIGKDITHKMYQIQEMLLNRSRDKVIRDRLSRDCVSHDLVSNDSQMTHGLTTDSRMSGEQGDHFRAIPGQILSRCSSIINMRSNLVRAASEQNISEIMKSEQDSDGGIHISPSGISHQSSLRTLPSSNTYETSV